MKVMYNKNLIQRARRLRNNMTKEERHLWYDFLKGYPVIILRQKVIGNYIADFYCPQAKVVIEVDGFQHELDYEVVVGDEERTKYFSDMGIMIYRVKNSDLNKNNFSNVCNQIDRLIKSRIN